MSAQELEVQEKKEDHTAEEKTELGKYYQPNTDIHEDTDRIVVSMDMPGVGKGGVEVELKQDVLTVTGQVDHARYEGLTPVHTEYSVGHFTRRFTVSKEIDQDAISAVIDEGVLTVSLPKLQKAGARKISVG